MTGRIYFLYILAYTWMCLFADLYLHDRKHKSYWLHHDPSFVRVLNATFDLTPSTITQKRCEPLCYRPSIYRDNLAIEADSAPFSSSNCSILQFLAAIEYPHQDMNGPQPTAAAASLPKKIEWSSLAYRRSIFSPGNEYSSPTYSTWTSISSSLLQHHRRHQRSSSTLQHPTPLHRSSLSHESKGTASFSCLFLEHHHIRKKKRSSPTCCSIPLLFPAASASPRQREREKKKLFSIKRLVWFYKFYLSHAQQNFYFFPCCCFSAEVAP